MLESRESAHWGEGQTRWEAAEERERRRYRLRRTGGGAGAIRTRARGWRGGGGSRMTAGDARPGGGAPGSLS